jgi:hypothetical protein
MVEESETEEKQTRRKSRKDEATSWERLPISKSGKQLIIIWRVSGSLRDRMKIVGNWVKAHEGIKHNFPGEFTKFCVETYVEGIEKIMEQDEQRTR